MQRTSLPNWLYRLLIAWRGPHYWHWRHYGWRYSARRDDGDGLEIRIDGRRYRARTLDRWQPPGEQIHILLSGPSVRAVADPALFLQHPTITVNGSFRTLEPAGKPADLYLVSDVGFVRRQWDTVREGIASARALAVDHRVLLEIAQRDPDLPGRLPLYVFDNLTRPYRRSAAWWRMPEDRLPREDRRCAFSTDPAIGFHPSCTVAYIALQIAAAQQPVRIVMFGLDLNGAGRAYAESTPERSMLLDDLEQRIIPDFRLAASVLRHRQVAVVNASPNSALGDEVFPRTDPQAALTEPI